jgi:hypothetical protein
VIVNSESRSTHRRAVFFAQPSWWRAACRRHGLHREVAATVAAGATFTCRDGGGGDDTGVCGDAGAASSRPTFRLGEQRIALQSAEQSGVDGDGVGAGFAAAGRAVQRCAATVAIAAMASLSLPFAANARGAPPPPSSSSSTMKEKMGDKVAKLNPNLIVLPEATQMKIEAGMVAAGEQMRSLARGIRTHMEDPWEVEDVWLIVAWHYAISKGRRRVFDGLAKWDKTCQVTEKGGVDAAFNSSFWNWLGGPMKVMGGVWVSLYLHDNLAKMFMMGRGIDFDVAMYALAVGAIAVMFTNRWLPIILERRAGG